MSDTSQLANRVRAGMRQSANWVQVLKFGLVGGSGYLINLAVFAMLLGGLGVHYVPAAVGAFCVAVTNNFLWNRYWTFSASAGPAGFQAVRFFAVSIASLVLNVAVLEALVSAASMGELTAQAIAVACAMPFNFLGNRLWTFAGYSPRASRSAATCSRSAATSASRRLRRPPPSAEGGGEGAAISSEGPSIGSGEPSTSPSPPSRWR